MPCSWPTCPRRNFGCDAWCFLHIFIILLIEDGVFTDIPLLSHFDVYIYMYVFFSRMIVTTNFMCETFIYIDIYRCICIYIYIYSHAQVNSRNMIREIRCIVFFRVVSNYLLQEMRSDFSDSHLDSLLSMLFWFALFHVVMYVECMSMCVCIYIYMLPSGQLT
jgi:hypothetical protein